MSKASASPNSLCGPISIEGLLSNIIPKKASSPHASVLERTVPRRKIQVKIGTKSTAQLASRVAFATEATPEVIES